MFHEEGTLARVRERTEWLERLLAERLEPLPCVAEIRQCGFIAGIELGTRKAEGGGRFPWEAQTGARVCAAARKHGLMTRPILDTLVLMPPYCVTREELERMVEALRQGILEVIDA